MARTRDAAAFSRRVRAREDITITGDFLAEAGGDFLAWIEPAPGGGGAKARMGEGVVETPLPVAPRLEPNYPNPFRHRTTFRFSIAENERVRLKIYDILGREVMTLVDGHHEPGNITLHWTATDKIGRPLPSGVYFYQLQVGDHVETGQMTLLN